MSAPPGRVWRHSRPALLVLAGFVGACAIYVNLAFAVRSPEDYRFFPPFLPNVNANNNRMLGAEYFHIARALAAGEGFAHPFGRPTGPTAWTAPLLPALWASVLWVSDGSRDAVMVVAILLQGGVLIGSAWLVLALARTTTRRLGPVAIVLLYGMALLCHFRFCFQVTGDFWLVLLTLDLLIASLCWTQPLGSKTLACAWGLLGGFCALVNPAVALAWSGFTLLLGWRERRLARLALAVLVAVLVLSPWLVRNYLIFGRLVPVKSNLAYELYQSQCLQPDGLLQRATYEFHPGGPNREGAQYSTLGETAFLERKREQFWQAVWADPLDYVDRAATRLLGATLWYVPFNRAEESGRPWVLWPRRVTHPVPFLALLVLAFTAMRTPLSWPQRVVSGVYLLYLLPYVLASYYERYAVPLLVVKALLVVWALDRLLARAPVAKRPL